MSALVTGLKHYLGPFEAYGKNPAKPPYRESQERLEYENFYYEQEDILFTAADRFGFTWSVHRPHTVIGFALGNAMNMGVTLGDLRHSGPGDGSPVRVPGFARAVRRHDRRHRRPASRSTARLGSH